MKGIRFLVFFLALSASLLCTTEAGRSRTSTQNSFRRAANGIYQTLSNVFGEDNIRGLYKFFSKTTERFVHGVDSFMDTIWKIWSDLLDVMGIDSQVVRFKYFLSPLSFFPLYSRRPERAVLPLCFIMALYFMTGPVGAYWRRGGSAIRLLNIRLSRVIDGLERSGEQ
uniref:Bri3 binding protein n=1 Tax=Labrus bergylta TaxID=56723 RepID=A0A3Q3FHR2_9LABR